MKRRAACAILMVSLAIFCKNLQAVERPTELRTALPVATLVGQSTMRVWGFDVYNASLWVAPGFGAADYPRHAFALELSYLRSFSGADIAKRSLSEMRRQGPIDAGLAARWEARMRAVFPDVDVRDRITGLHQPGFGAVFFGNGRPLGVIDDPAFATAFFGIWLSPQTSAPSLRTALLAGLPAAGSTWPDSATPAAP